MNCDICFRVAPPLDGYDVHVPGPTPRLLFPSSPPVHISPPYYLYQGGRAEAETQR
ncbi:hypothetical protein BJV78DRAFT_1210036 [Lactifluus subvellereus]|nr:hypothetical protein BJV78DRAFT_1210036 [Lactifluus subvellereus]